MSETKSKNNETTLETFVEGVDYYFENGLMVLTARFLKNRGYCCRNNCRHCPYQFKENQYKEKISS